MNIIMILDKMEKMAFHIGRWECSLLFVVRLLMVGLFPLFIALATELNHIQSLGSLFSFMGHNLHILLLDYFIVSVVFLLVSLLFKKTFISMAITGLLFYIIS